MNENLSKQISSQAIILAETETELANLRGKHEIASADQQREAEVLRISSEAYATEKKLKTNADNQAVIDKAKASAEASVIKASANSDALLKENDAKAKSLLMMKEAEAKGVRLIAQAEAERAEMLQKTGLGREIALAEIYSETMTKSLQGVDKVVYLPTEKGMFSFLDMQVMSKALEKFSK